MSLKNKTINGIKWTSLSAIIVSIAQFIQIVVLARFISPETFGLMATLMVIIGFSQLFMDMGISKAIVHYQDITHSQLSSLYWLNIISGIILFIILALLTPLVSNFYQKPSLETPLLLTASTFIITALGNQYRNLCQKEMLFNVSAKIEIIAVLLSVSTAILLAVAGLKIYALVFGILVSTTISSCLYLYFGLKNQHRPSLYFNYREIRHFFKFGMYQLGDKSTNYFSTNIDKLLISNFLGIGATGFYDMAWKLIVFPIKAINPIINNVTFPVYAKIQNDVTALNRYYFYAIKSISIITIPILTLLCVNSGDIVTVVLGNGWGVTATILVPLSLVGVIRALGNPGGTILLALGYANVCFWWNAAWASVVTVCTFAILFINPDIETLAITVFLLYLTIGSIWHYLISKYGNIKYKRIILESFKIIIICFIIALSCQKLTSQLGVNNSFLTLVSSSLFFTFIYSLYLYFFEKKIILQFFK